MSSFALVVAAVTPSLAHWVDETSASVGVMSGSVAMSVDGELAFEIDGCVGEPESGCHKLEDEELTGLPVVSVGGASFTVLEWIDKEEGEHVGFVFELTGGSVESTLKSGNPNNDNGSLITEVFHEAGTHTWLNPACEVDPATGDVSCDPKNTAAISYIDVCLSEIVATGCDGPVETEVVLENSGTIPLAVALDVVDPTAAVCADSTPPIDLVVWLMGEDGVPMPEPVYRGSLCFLAESAPLSLVEQIDPGASVAVHFAVELGAGATPPPDGIDVSLSATFAGSQWNSSVGWKIDRAVPFSVLAEVGVLPAAPPEVDPQLPPPPPVEPPPEDPPVDDPPVEDPPDGDPPAEGPPDGDPPAEGPPDGDPPPELVNLTGMVWVDEGDGIRDPAEPGAAGVAVDVFGATGEFPIVSVVTADDGSYAVDLEAGPYRVRVAAPDGHVFTEAKAGTDPSADSDVIFIEEPDPTGEAVGYGWTDPIDVVAGLEDGFADAGLLALLPVDDPPVEEPPGEDPPSEEPPVEEPPVEEPPGEDPPSEDPPSEDPPSEDPPSEEPPGEEPPGEEPPGEEPPGEEPPGEEPPSEEPPADEPPAEEEPAVVTFGGIVWFDDGDGVRIDLDPDAESDPDEEPVEPELRVAGAAVALYELDRETVVATAETDDEGVYEFVDVPEGSYLIRVEPLGGFSFAVGDQGDDEEQDSDIVELEEIFFEEELEELYGWTALLEVIEDMDPGLGDAGLVPLPPDEEETTGPPTEDPGEIAVEPPEVPGSKDDDTQVDPHAPDDSTPDDGVVEGGEGDSG